MISSIGPLVSDPVVAYRLDTDEPGVANPARASQSAYTVVGQESRNRARLRSEALLEGRQVLLVKTDYKVRRVGSFTVPVGGLTTVITRGRPGRPQPATAVEQSAAAIEEPGEDQAGVRKVIELRAEQQRLETELRELEQETEDTGQAESAGATSARQRAAKVEWRLDQIERELDELGVTSGASACGPNTASAAKAFGASLDVAGQLIDILL